MRIRMKWSGAAVAAALVLGTLGQIGLAPASAETDESPLLSVPGMPVSLAQSGELKGWGDNTWGQMDLPAELEDVAISQVVIPSNARLALTADGRVFGWGGNQDRLEMVPDAVKAAKVKQIATNGGYAGAVTRDGHVMVWGKKRIFPTAMEVPEGLNDVKQLAMGDYGAAALKNDGTVVAWGETNWGLTDVPEGLKATSIVAEYNTFYALSEQGTLVPWGYSDSAPPALQEPGSVKAIAAANYGVTVLLANNTVTTVIGSNLSPVPPEVAAAEPVLLASGTGVCEFAIVDSDRTIHFWAQSPGAGEIPAVLNGLPITQIALGRALDELANNVGSVIVTKLLRAELPQISGIAEVGSVLTGTEGTFSASPDNVASQWLVDGTPVEAAAEGPLTVTAAMASKQITYRSTATKAGETTIWSTSEALTVPVPKSDPTVTISAPAGTYGTASTVTVTVPGATGDVSLTMNGAPLGTTPLSSSTASFSVASTTAPGSYALVATYAGSETFNPGSATGTLTIGTPPPPPPPAVVPPQFGASFSGNVKGGKKKATVSVKVRFSNVKTKKVKGTVYVWEGARMVKRGSFKKGKGSFKFKAAKGVHTYTVVFNGGAAYGTKSFAKAVKVK